MRYIRMMDNLFFSDLGGGGGKNRFVKTKLYLVAGAALATIILSPPVLFAGSEYDISKETPPPPPQPWCETPKTLEIRIGVPGWMAGVSGNSGVKGVVTSPDVSFDQILTHLTHIPLSLSVDIRYQRWEILRRWSLPGCRCFCHATWFAFYQRQYPPPNRVCRRIRRLSSDQLR